MYNKDHEIEATFESTYEDHEDCPSSKVIWNDHEGECLVHDEWFVMPDEIAPNAGSAS